MEPKARWQREGEGWSADVGPFHLLVNNAGDGRAELYDGNWKGLWEHVPTAPYDVTDLMRLAESELARRLEKTAATMDGGELVVSAAERFMTGRDGYCALHSEENRSLDAAALVGWDVAETNAEEPRFKVGDLVRHRGCAQIGTVLIDRKSVVLIR